MAYPCPECGAALAGKMYDGVAFSECPQCAGVWFFEDDLKHLETENVQDLDAVDLLEAPIKPVGAPSALLACPMCGGAMQQYHFMEDNPIVIHRCTPCAGLWMEHGQLKQMAEAASGTVPQPAPAVAPAGQAAPRVESAAELGFDQQHAAAMAHYQTITNACRLFNTRIRSYGGLMW
jgi:Zn-finger nucleic acid-binding protein